ncbi:protein-export chaperone SecB [Phreatobacter sp. AB_2022a]|uniref:protein-export chaperone SecB n=1 Tax=Phreatobacter sp. AB_2022a TaxID=3003134 RepID=UPI00056EEFFB|nr:protein-export chaperone SecB [Phreatobacter sp. AB_2022a]MCZ0736858.1 protein-export chaperone SecB [Phreatobacter sp. AB_2022a]CEJ15865.1 Protein-export protein SecB [bacterium YEK0313]
MTPNGGNEAEAVPQLNVLAQYIKDLSFENPNAPRSLMPQQEQPAINIQINVNANPMSETEFQIELTIDGDARTKDLILFKFELVYGGIFRIAGVPAEAVHPIVLIECPRLLFPFARQIIANSTRDGGFPPLYLDPVDFAALYRQRMAENPQGQGGPALTQ